MSVNNDPYNRERPEGLPRVPMMGPISSDSQQKPEEDEYDREMRRRREARAAKRAAENRARTSENRSRTTGTNRRTDENGITYDYVPRRRPQEDINLDRERARRKAEREVFKRHRSFQVFIFRFVTTLLWIVALGMAGLAIYMRFVIMPELQKSAPTEESLWETADIKDLFPAVTEHIISGTPLAVDQKGNIVATANKYILNEEDPDSWFNGTYELPLNGAAGYASVNMALTDEAGTQIGSCAPGDSFTILADDGTNLEVILADGTRGYLDSRYCMINLPDVLPSIIYYDSNSDSSIFRSMGYDLPGVTGQKLYDVMYENSRLDREQYAMPVLFSMAAKIAEAQKSALEYGCTLKIYETYRPYDVQMTVSSALLELINSNSEVNAGVNTPPWSQSWFIAQSLSNHQSGCAMDVSLARINDSEEKILIGEDGEEYPYLSVTESKESDMPTQMHELSSRACVFKQAVDSKSRDAWRSCQLSDSMTSEAILLQSLCTDAGLSPLASEWWHFNDLDARENASANRSGGRYFLQPNLSLKPGEVE